MMNMISCADNTVFHHGHHLITGISGSDSVFNNVDFSDTFYFKLAPMGARGEFIQTHPFSSIFHGKV